METSGWNWLTSENPCFEHRKTGYILDFFLFCGWLHKAIFMGIVAISVIILNLTFLVLMSNRMISFCLGRTPCMLRMKREITGPESFFITQVQSTQPSELTFGQ